MKGKNKSCFMCAKRHIGCHSNCPDYEYKPPDEKDIIVNHYIYDSIRRMKRRSNKK